MRALVTGATGGVGANLVRALGAAGHDVRALVRADSDTRAIDGLPIERVTGDVLDPASLRAAADGCELLFHAAAIFSYWGHDADELRRTAVDGTRHALAAAKDAGVRRVVLTSSTVTLGSRTTTVPIDEDGAPLAGDTPDYFRAKIEQEQVALALADELGVELVIACPSIVVGPHDYRLSPSNGIIVAYWEDLVGTTWPGGINVVHAEDVARGHLLLAERGAPGARYVLGGDNLEWSLVHRTIAELSGLPPPRVMANHTTSYLVSGAMEAFALVTGTRPRSTRAQAQQVGRFYWYSHARAAALGYAPRPARTALAQTIAWMLIKSPHVGRALRARLRPAREVLAAREAYLA